MRAILIFLLGLFLFAACGPSATNTLSGEVTDNNQVRFIKVFSKERGHKPLDSAQVVNGTFGLNFRLKHKEILEIRTDDHRLKRPLFFYEPGAKYHLHIKGNSVRIEAPKNSLQATYNSLLEELDPLNGRLIAVSKDTTLGKEALNDLSKEYFHEIIDFKKAFIKKHPESFISLYFLKDMVKLGRILSFHELSALYKIVNIDAHKEEPMLNFIDTTLKRLEGDRIVGNQAPDFLLPSTDGKRYGIKDFTGGYTLIDFWASWCAPCRVANRKIIPLYEKYSDKGFTIVSISFDDDRAKWLKAIEEDNIPWTQLSDLKGFNKSEIKELYKVESLPTTYVMDAHGKVVDQHLKHHELEALLVNLYGH